ncbi:hypothetical protein [Sagittula salina]|uniref:Uncharacterized protein n=1 Tax=Sagittula salina TaxID=2820268 RepID=A0A940S2W6_9RHOB|nr:hypothetical protein [Sagittula salina]MBP0484517.1 hypothetical protein [Sagittula salina]
MAQTSHTPTPTIPSLDQFYTRPDTAAMCVALLAEYLPAFSPDLYVEPSAGDGVFLDRLPQPRFGIDIAPAAPGIASEDFLTWAPDDASGTIAVVGNPPFGRNASKAIAFFNHAAGFAEVIAMIMPASLTKGSMQDRLDENFHLVGAQPLHAEAFRVDETLHEVNAVFQIWRRGGGPRPKSIRKTEHPDFRFVATATEADLVIRRVGARAGALLPPPEDANSVRGYAPASNLFVKAARITPQDLETRFGQLDFSEVRQCAAANPSVSKSDIVALYEAQTELERIAQVQVPQESGAGRAPLSPELIPPAQAMDGDLVAMIVHHPETDPTGLTPPRAVEFRWRHESAFPPVLHTALRGKRRRQALRLLEDLFARRGPWANARNPRYTTSILFHDALLHLDLGNGSTTAEIDLSQPSEGEECPQKIFRNTAL